MSGGHPFLGKKKIVIAPKNYFILRFFEKKERKTFQRRLLKGTFETSVSLTSFLGILVDPKSLAYIH
jgi:hypothetical protein